MTFSDPDYFSHNQTKILKTLFTDKDTFEILDPIVQIAGRAGTEVFRIFQNLSQVTTRLKDDRSPVCDADIASNLIIETGLKSLYPDLPIISEETKQSEDRHLMNNKVVWLIDPLDGTKEFLNGIGEFAINIALVVDKIPVMGVIHNPSVQQTFGAVKGQGVYVWAPDAVPRKLQKNTLPSKPYKVLTSRYHAPISNLDSKSFEITPCGSSLKFCRLAEGSCHIYPRFAPTMEWDTAAGQCLVEESGGSIVGLEGQSLRYNKSSLINPHFIAVSHSSLLNDPLFQTILSFRENPK